MKSKDEEIEDAVYTDAESPPIERPQKPLPSIPMPPSGAVKLAFFTAIRYKSINKAISAYNSAVFELANTEVAYTALKNSMVEHERVTRLLEDSESIHKRDREKRIAKGNDVSAQLLKSEDALEEEKHRIHLRRQARERERRKADQEHAAFSVGEVPENDDMTDEEREFAEHLEGKTQPGRFRQIAENIINNYTASKGGVLSEVDEAHIQSIRDACEEAINDMS